MSSRGRPGHARMNLPVSLSLRNRWWCDLVMRSRMHARRKGKRTTDDSHGAGSGRNGKRSGNAAEHAGKPGI